ncbi:MAG: palmitoyltransferase pfa5 [Pleopsidium flavum]|nr:MAG: palmitoyltransferase pfa5 [Pleopsidium flavum]
MAIFVAEVKAETGQLSVHWVLILGFAALFGLFALGMAGGSIQLALINSTTVENLTRKTKVWQLAVRLPESYQHPPMAAPGEGSYTTSLRIVTYPLPPQPSTATHPPLAIGTHVSSDRSAPVLINPTPPRTFAILKSKPGDNPWDLGPLENFKQVMGKHWWDWLLPLKYSPCTNHESRESAFALGAVVERMCKEAGIPSNHRWEGETHKGQRRKSRTGSAPHRERSHRIRKSADSEQRRLRRDKRKRSRGQRKEHDERNVVR